MKPVPTRKLSPVLFPFSIRRCWAGSIKTRRRMTYRTTQQRRKKVIGCRAAECLACLTAADRAASAGLSSARTTAPRGRNAGRAAGSWCCISVPIAGGHRVDCLSGAWTVGVGRRRPVRSAGRCRGDRRRGRGASGRPWGAAQHSGDQSSLRGFQAWLGFAELGQHPRNRKATSLYLR